MAQVNCGMKVIKNYYEKMFVKKVNDLQCFIRR